MDNDAKNRDSIIWTKRKEWGLVGFVHRTNVTIGGTEYHFTLDQPVKGRWVARGWKDGEFFYYRDRHDARTLTGLKDEVELAIGHLLVTAKTAAKDGVA